MKILIGSKNPAKIEAVGSVFHVDNVTGIEVTSQVSAQPQTDEETRRGAINRARQCVTESTCDIGIGLEGGVMTLDNQLYVTNWGALVHSDGTTFTAGGARIQLPQEFSAKLNQGMELGDIMDDFAKRKDVRKKEGAIGIFTNELISRKEMFVHVVTLLKGQYDFSQK
ncbi:DUF84 family protein [Virgibacillus ihumii]|uniref:DUF84 family protein n=1 Tax=Virgibacillus ihumii TaxID=2686091 RepID=UPI00157CC27D|nr:DUF84 family protein [Virgibacillus ihumii]